MGRSTICFATALMLFASAADAADVPQGALLSGASPAIVAALTSYRNVSMLPLTNRADRPRYDKSGWSCPAGFVWRNAGSSDWLCVDPFEARQIRHENELAPENWIQEPDGTRSCRAGLVRREAIRRDSVCVDPLRRESVKKMNVALYTVR